MKKIIIPETIKNSLVYIETHPEECLIFVQKNNKIIGFVHYDVDSEDWYLKTDSIREGNDFRSLLNLYKDLVERDPDCELVCEEVDSSLIKELI